MADSLRDQLIAAGYEAPKKEEKRKSRPHAPKKQQARGKKTGDKSKPRHKQQHSSAPAANRPPTGKSGSKPGGNGKSKSAGNATHSAEALQAIEERKKLKAQIKTLIDENKLENWKGEVVYRYLVEKRIRELYVNEEMHKQLAERSVAVTRLNGDTYLVPLATAATIKEINPQWSVFNTDADAEDNAELKSTDTAYADYKVPDDLKW